MKGERFCERVPLQRRKLQSLLTNIVLTNSYIIMAPNTDNMTDQLPRSKPFKQRKSLACRREEVAGIRTKFPTKIPVIVERYSKETQLPTLDKSKFLVPQELTMSQFVTIIRNKLQLSPNQTFYLIVNNRSMASMSKTLAEVYREHKDEDGFLYVTYASQEMFG